MAYQNHARRHLKGGTDPLAGIGEAALAYVSFVGTQSVAGSGGEVTFAYNNSFYTTDTEVFGTGSGTPAPPASNMSGDNALLLMAPGIYLAFGNATWEPGSYDHVTFVDVDATGEVLTQTGFTPVERFSFSSADISPESVQATYVSVSPGAYTFLSLKAKNFDSSSHDISEAFMSCMYWPITLNAFDRIF